MQCARIQKRVKISALAVQMKVSPKLLRDIEEGVSFPSSQMMKSLEVALDMKFLPEGDDDDDKDASVLS